MIIFIFLLIILLIADAFLYAAAPYEIRSGHWWSWLPGSGYYAQYKYIQKEQHIGR